MNTRIRPFLLALLAVALVATATAEGAADSKRLTRITHIHGLAVDPATADHLLLATQRGFYRLAPDGLATLLSAGGREFTGFAAGTGNPFFTTDTAAALRAAEMDCEALLKGTQVDGVYSDDPKTAKNAERFDRLSYRDVLTRDLRIMDASAIALARDNKVPILVFSLHNPGTFAKIVIGDGTCTIIS